MERKKVKTFSLFVIKSPSQGHHWGTIFRYP